MDTTKAIVIPADYKASAQFAIEVKQGFDCYPRSLSSKWFYDERGDQLFQQIMASPEYYLTDSERSIFQHQAADFLKLAAGQPFDLVELGAGDGTKTQYLIEHFIEKSADFRYLPIDISRNALNGLSSLVKSRWPDLKFAAIEGDYFEALNNLPADNGCKRKKIVLFPGGNIGNFTPVQATAFLLELNLRLADGDLLITGFDLKKNPAKILAAYNDAGGATAAFNLNLLHRINRELGADFDLDSWGHWPTYDPITGATRSYVVSMREQSVYIKALQESFRFAAYEAIDLEISQKYSLPEIEQLAQSASFKLVDHFIDDQVHFVDSVWRV